MVFSTRLNADLRPNPLTLLLRDKHHFGERILDLTESNPTHAILPYPDDEILKALADPSALRYDPDPAGMLTAREAVSAYYASRGLAVNPLQILLTSSTSEAYSFLFKLLCDPGDEVLVPRPSYPLFEYLAAMESVNLKRYPLVYERGWRIDCDSLEAQIGPKTRAIIVVNPNNPTGSFLKRDELRKIEEWSIPILADEVFADYSFRDDPNRVHHLAQFTQSLSFVMSGLSKLVALPQLKLGWIVVNGQEGIRDQAFERLEWIADTYLSVGTPVQCATGKLLGLRHRIQNGVCARVQANLQHLRRQLGADSPFRLLDAEGGWYATIEVPRMRTEEEWALELLREDNVLVQPGYFYDFEREAYLVLSLLTPLEVFSEGVGKLVQRA